MAVHIATISGTIQVLTDAARQCSILHVDKCLVHKQADHIDQDCQTSAGLVASHVDKHGV